MALAAYRHILRSTRIAFKDDLRVLHAARHTARQNFNDQRSLAPSSPEAVAGIEHAEGVAVVLRRQVVQGERIEHGSEEGGGGKYQLRIHPETELGDNSTIKMDGKSTGQVTGQCCGASQ